MDRPQIETQEYFDYMTVLIGLFEQALPVEVYGFSYYSTVAFHWKMPDGKTSSTYATIPFVTFEMIAKGVQK